MRRARLWGLAAAGIGVWLWLPELLPGRQTVLVLLALYVPIVVGISLLAGYTGQVSVGQAAFFGMGAYGTGILTVHAGFSPWLAMPVAVTLAGMAAFAIGAPIFLLRGHYLVLATIGFNVIFEVVARQLDGVTGGASGLIGIPALSFGGEELITNEFFYYAGSGLAAVSIFLSLRLVKSRVGRALQAIEGSETAAATLGIARRRYATQIFAWSAVLAAASGALYAEWLRFISPSSFGVDVSVDLLIMAVIGGIASVPGALVGAALFVAAREVLREVVPSLAGTGSGGGSAEYELIVFGLLLAAVVIFMPEGIWPRLARLLRGADRDRTVPADPVRVSEARPATAHSIGEPILEVENVSRRFGGLTALDDVSFTIRRGEIFGVIGPNGAGKTTLLNLLSGVIRPSAGQIRLEGRALTELPADRVGRLGLARSFQTPRVFGLLSVVENVKAGRHRHLGAGFVRSLLGLNRREEAETTDQALDVLAVVGERDAAGAMPGSLPFGKLRMAELARALASEPKLILLDEPASGLSSAERTELKKLINGIRDRGVTVVLVEHDVPFVTELADRVLVLHNGKKLAEGLPERVCSEPAVIKAYLGVGGAVSADGARRPRPAQGAAPLLRIEGVSAGYGAVRVLHDVSLDAFAGEVVAVLGPNGAGKTTLLRALMGIIPAEGQCTVDGVPITGLGPERIVRLGVALVPEGRELLPQMSVRDHLVLGAYARGARPGQEEFERDLERVEKLFPVLAERRDARAESLSGGQQQMLAIARALMGRPRLLLLDEPLLGLAPLVVEDILASVTQLADEGLGVVIVEQNAATVLPIVDRAYVLENGRVVMAGSAAELAGDPELQLAFLGRGALAAEHPSAPEPVSTQPVRKGEIHS